MDQVLLEAHTDQNLDFYMYIKKEYFKLIDVPNLSISDTLVIPSLDVAKVHIL